MPRTPGWPPPRMTPIAWASRGTEAIEFIETFCRGTKDSIGGRAGDLLVLEGWQKRLILALLAERPGGLLAHRQALIMLPSKNGKSTLGAGLALWSLMCGPDGWRGLLGRR